MAEPNPTYALACSGGGALGAYQVGVLKYLHRNLSSNLCSPFRVFTGSSAGSLNAGFLACRSHDARNAILELEELWRNFHVPAYYGSPVAKALRSLPISGIVRSRRKQQWSLLPQSHLRDIAERGFSTKSLETALREGTTAGLAVATTEFQTASQVWFAEGPAAVNWDNGIASSVVTRIEPIHLIASCSVPLVFPLVRIGDRFYSDGDVANHDPLGIAIGMGARRILHIGMRAPRPREIPPLDADYVPTTGDVVRMLLSGMRYDQATMQAGWLEVLNYFCDRLPTDPTKQAGRTADGQTVDLDSYRPVEVEIFRPSQPLEEQVLLPKTSRRAPRGLHFHRDFISALIELGESDAAERHESLARFFKSDRPQRVSRFERRGNSDE